MGILTDKTEVKKLIQISDSNTSKDDLIDALIPIIQSDIINLTNNHFKDQDNYYENTSISFNKTDKKILDSDSYFLTSGFAGGMDIYVEGSLNNDGFYKITAATAGELTVSYLADQSMYAESAGEFVRITRVLFPYGLKMIAAMMIKQRMDKQAVSNVQSERLGDHSISFKQSSNIGGSIYSDEIQNMLNEYRKLSFA